MAKKKSKTKKLPNMSLFGTNGSRGSKNPYAGIKPYPSVKPQPTTPTPWKKSVVKNPGDKAK